MTQLTPYTLPLLTATALSFVYMIYALKNTQLAGSKEIALLMVVNVLWITGYNVEISFHNTHWKEAAFYLQQIKLINPLILFSLANRLAGSNYLSGLFAKRILWGLGLFMLVLLAFNPYFHYLWVGVVPQVTNTYAVHYKPMHFVLVAIGMSAAGAALLVLIGAWQRGQHLYRAHILRIGIGMLLVHLFSLYVYFQPSYTTRIEAGPIPVLILATLFFYHYLRSGNIPLTPISRDMVLNGIEDSIIVLDNEGNIIDINSSAASLLAPTKNVVGYPADTVISQTLGLTIAQIASRTKQTQEFHYKEAIYELRLSPLTDGSGQNVGKLLVATDISEKVKQESQKRKTEQRLSLHLQQTSVAYIEWNLNWEVTEWNVAAERIFGYKRADMLGKRAYQYITPTTIQENFVAYFQTMVLERKAISGESENITRDGRKIICEWFGNPIIDHDQEVIALATFGVEITQQRQMVEALRLSESRFRNLAENFPDFIIIYDLEKKKVVYANRESFLGYAPSELQFPEALFAFSHPDDLAVSIDIWEKINNPTLHKENELYNTEFRVKSKSGGWHWLQGRICPIYPAIEADSHAPNGNAAAEPKLTQVLITYTDIDKRKRAEEQVLYQSSLLAHLKSAVVATDTRGTILFWNPYAELYFGKKAADVLGKNLVRVVEEVFSPATAAAIVAKMQTFAPWEGEFTFEKGGKPGMPVFISTAKVENTKGELLGFVGLLVDQTERHNAEQNLRKALADAEAASRARAEFLAAVSHEIRTPMNAVLGMTSLLLQTTLNAEQNDYVQTIRNSGELLLALLNNILDYHKFGSASVQLESQPFDLHKLLEDVFQLFVGRAKDRGLDLVGFVHEDVPQVIIGDAIRLQQVLINLIDNGLKFTEKGEITITVTVAQHTPQTKAMYAQNTPLLNNLELAFRVQDTGCGIAADKVEAIFQPFIQLEQGAKRRGSGLGLSICRNLVALMGGNLTVESVVGKGSIFQFTIKTQTTQTKPNTVATFGKGLSVLVCSASNSVRNFVSYLCTQHGFDVQNTTSLTEAMLLLANQNPDKQPTLLIYAIKDVFSEAQTQLPQFRQHFASTRVIVIRSVDSETESTIDHYCDCVLTRPLRSQTLSEGIQKVLGLATASAPQPGPNTFQLDSTLAEKLPLRILIAEDNPINQKMMNALLKKMGYNPTIVEDGLAVLSLMQNQSFDVIFMDIQMPGLDGIETTKRLNTLYGSNRPVIIALTADAFTADREKCIAAGMDDYISKPIRLEQIQAVLTRIGNTKLSPKFAE